jgi:hypothetical protein
MSVFILKKKLRKISNVNYILMHVFNKINQRLYILNQIVLKLI